MFNNKDILVVHHFVAVCEKKKKQKVKYTVIYMD